MNDFDTIISPFFGGGSFEFYIQNRYKMKIIANDIFTLLFNFWKVCKNNEQRLCEELYDHPKITKEKFLELRDTIMDNRDELQQAMSYFIIKRCSFSGSILSGGYSNEASKKRFTKSSIDRISKLELISIYII